MGSDTFNTAGHGSDDDFQELFPKLPFRKQGVELASKKNAAKRPTKRFRELYQGGKLHVTDFNAALNSQRDGFLLSGFATQYVCSTEKQKKLETQSAFEDRVDEKRNDLDFGSQLHVADSNVHHNDLLISECATKFICSNVLDPVLDSAVEDAIYERGEDSNFGSQMNALLRLCSQAGQDVDGHPNVQKSSEEGFSAENEDCTSLMTPTDTSIEVEEQPVTKEHFVSTSSCKRTITVLEDVTNRELKSSNSVDKDSLEKKRKRFSDGQDLVVHCPVCKAQIGDISLKEREAHTNKCLDRLLEQPKKDGEMSKVNAVDVTPVVKWLETLNLSKYAPLFIKEEIDWDTLQWLTEEDLSNLGIAAFGPRKKIVSALLELKQGSSCPNDDKNSGQSASGKKYITDFFGLPSKTGDCKPEGKQQKPSGVSHNKKQKKPLGLSKFSNLPQWMSIPGTKFRVDAFQHLTNDCSHWFLTHFHSDHYQGLTKGFRFGKIYCSLVTARLINLRIGIPWDRLHPLQLSERTKIDGVWVTLLDANHCPGAAMVLFEPPNGKIVLHTGDFRFCDEMAKLSVLMSTKIQTLILDTTYCNAQYDFPKQETVVQFVIDAIQAESFNLSTLFLIGTYTLGKERLFLEVARVLRKKIYVGAVKRRMLACLDLSNEDMNWITTSDTESCIHVVPLWSIASFKRMASISKHYHGRFSTIVSFSPTGWNFGRGKKRTPGRRWQQGTIIRYEVPYSEHSSFTELKEFVKLISPETIIPSVNNTSTHAAQSMIALLRS